jgi:tetratricopeptide (TPR) repeat protein
MFALSGYIDRRDGRWADATRNLEKAMELNPHDFRLLVQVLLLYQRLRRYSDAIAVADQALHIVPGDPNTRIERAGLEVDWRGEIQPYQKALGALLSEDPSLGPEIEEPNYALCDRTASAANRAIANLPPEGVATNGTMFPKPYWQAVIERCQGSDAAARASFTVARQIVEKTVQEQPDHAIEHSLLGLIDAGLGRKDEAIREGRRACEILPPTKDAIDGTALEANLAQIYAWTGEKDAAIAEIAEIERAPNLLSYGLLKLSPVWDSLRGDPRFEKIVNSLAPK